MFLFPTKIMVVREYMEFLDMFGFVVVRRGYASPKLFFPYFDGSKDENEKIHEYADMLMEHLLQTTIEKYERVLRLPGNFESDEWEKKYQTLRGWQAAYLRGDPIFVNGIEFRKKN